MNSKWYVEVQLFATDDLRLGPFPSKDEALVAVKRYTTKHISDMYHGSIFQALETVGCYEDDDLMVSVYKEI